jgi:hypothetical protein
VAGYQVFFPHFVPTLNAFKVYGYDVARLQSLHPQPHSVRTETAVTVPLGRSTLRRVYGVPNHVRRGVQSVTVDGETAEGNVLPTFADGQTHLAEVTMGQSSNKDARPTGTSEPAVSEGQLR